ncbi:MAG: hypothetical protein HQK94_09915 [Nitrospirae bacterium]|nr:hypothetical protein [Nitrospirota bacterium]MBF0536144.1 hypothetical protein [Nitrospirota bacterium]
MEYFNNTSGAFIAFSVAFLCLILLFPKVSLADTQQDEFNKAVRLFDEGQKLYNISDYRGAIQMWDAALIIYQNLDDKHSISATLGNLGDAYLALDSDEEAFSNFTKIDSYIRLGRYYLKKKNFKEAERQFDRNKLLLGIDASEKNVKAENLSSRRYLLFSTHGILGNEIPYIKQPALVLNLVGNDKEEDGFLTVSKVVGLNLNSDLGALGV